MGSSPNVVSLVTVRVVKKWSAGELLDLELVIEHLVNGCVWCREHTVPVLPM